LCVLTGKKIAKETFPQRIIIQDQEGGWMNEDAVDDWMKNFYDRMNCYVNDPRWC
jgi:predicted DNA-binding transcriptional regulator AlpA